MNRSCRTRLPLLAGAMAGPLFVTTFTVAGARRPGYDPARHPVSSLALGPGGWVQAINFAVTGALVLAGAGGLARAAPGRVVPALVGAAGAGLLGSAVFVTDPVGGYPAGTPDVPEVRTRAGTVHDLVALPIFLGLPAAALLDSWRRLRAGDTGRALGSGATAAVMLAGLGRSAAVSAGAPGRDQRVAVVAAFGWLTALMLERARSR